MEEERKRSKGKKRNRGANVEKTKRRESGEKLLSPLRRDAFVDRQIAKIRIINGKRNEITGKNKKEKEKWEKIKGEEKGELCVCLREREREIEAKDRKGEEKKEQRNCLLRYGETSR